MTTEDELIEDVKYWKGRFDAAQAELADLRRPNERPANYEDRHPGPKALTTSIMRAVREADGTYLNMDDPDILWIMDGELEAILESEITTSTLERAAALLGDIAVECMLRGMRRDEMILDFIKRKVQPNDQ